MEMQEYSSFSSSSWAWASHTHTSTHGKSIRGTWRWRLMRCSNQSPTVVLHQGPFQTLTLTGLLRHCCKMLLCPLRKILVLRPQNTTCLPRKAAIISLRQCAGKNDSLNFQWKVCPSSMRMPFPSLGLFQWGYNKWSKKERENQMLIEIESSDSFEPDRHFSALAL